VWSNLGYTKSENDLGTSRSDSKRWHGSVGADLTLDDWLIVGLAAGFESDDTDTIFNGDNIEMKGFPIVTYVDALLTDQLSVDLAIGRTYLETDQFRTSGTTRITSGLKGARVFAAGNLNYGWSIQDWRIRTRAGLLWLRDDQGAFAESNSNAVARSVFRVGRAKFDGEVSRTYGVFEPFLRATYNTTFTLTQSASGGPSPDRDDMLINLGVRYFGENSLSGALEFNTLLGRDNIEEYSVNLLSRSEF
jgi:outer membrane autotransporter protein